MKPSLLALIGAAVLSAVAAVAIAGLPGGTDADASVIIDVTPTTSPTTVPVVTVAPTPETTTTAAPPTTEPPGTTVTTTTVAAEDPLTPRADLTVAVANAANRGGLATQTVARLTDLGYVDALAADASTRAEITVFHADGIEAEATRLLEDLGLGQGSIASAADAPATTPARDVQLLLVLGTDTPASP